MRKSTLIAIIVIAVLIVGAVVALNNRSNSNKTAPPSSANPTASGANQAPAAGSIDIRNMMFTPSQITVAKGGTVTWTNHDSTTHTVIDDLSNVGGPASGEITPGSSYSFRFTKTGSFQYHCRIHPSMRGTIVVK